MQRVQSLLKRLIRPLWLIWTAEVRAAWRRSPVRPRTVLYESFAGNGALCNPEAIFRELLDASDLADLQHIWVLNSFSRHRAFRAEFAGHPRVRFVRYRSVGYFRALATSGYLINNATFPPEFGKRPGQIYLNTWHGTPLKRMGYDMPDGAYESSNTLRNFVSADYLLSQNPFMTRQMYESSYKLRGVFQGRILETGYPRVDHQFAGPDARSAALARLQSADIDPGDRQIVLYAPTWKGETFSSPHRDAGQPLETVRRLQDLLGAGYLVLLKSHQIIHQALARGTGNRSVMVPNEIPANIVLGVTDILITDYSSIFFDFLATGRPVVFYTPDAAGFADTRGTYFGEEDLPGPVHRTLDQVAASVNAYAAGGAPDAAVAARYTDWRRRFTANDDGNASRRVVDAVFRGVTDVRSIRSIADDPRTRILLHLGSMRPNGITTSALNLLAAIDHDRYDVTVIFNRPAEPQQRSNQQRIDPRVRQFHRMGGMNGSKAVHLRRKLSQWRAIPGAHTATPGQRQLWNDEWIRCFGQARFDRVVDFDGYGPFWATLLLHGPALSRSIWFHNDMVAETHRIIRGKERLRRSLHAVFALYHEFDALVSVSPSLNEVNRRGLSGVHGLRPDLFVSARNLVDGAHVLAAARIPLSELPEHRRQDSGAPGVADWLGELSIHAADGMDPGREGGSGAGTGAGPGTRWFVTIGRFSTEKNQSRLLRAFSQVHRARPEARLLLVGYGPLHDELQRMIGLLGLNGSAFLAGPYSNPFPLLAAADCFVLSSNHEGQPMVLLEAAIVGLPIVSVDFGTIRDALPDSVIRIVDQDDDALAEGMLAYLRGEVPPQRLDVERYNRAALGEFIAVVTAAVPCS